LDALFQPSGPQQQTDRHHPDTYSRVPLDAIEPNPEQPRKHFSQEALEELAQSIQSQGLLQPLLVRPLPDNPDRYQIIAGERRWKAARQAELTEVPALIRDISDSEALIIGLIENLQREDLNALEEAEALKQLQQELKLSQDELSDRIGRSRSSIANSLRLLQLEPEIHAALRDKRISAGQARTLLGFTDSRTRLLVFEQVLARGLTVREIEQALNTWKKRGALPKSLTAAKGSDTRKTADPDFVKAKKRIQQTMADKLQAKVRINGEAGQGRISLQYSSKDELQRILAYFGISSPECFT
jgi:ParB family chromosome partitioning protein